MMKDVLRPLIPAACFPIARNLYRSWQRWRTNRRSPISESQFLELLRGPLQVKEGDVLFVHSSADFLHLDFPVYGILKLLRTAVGESGTLLFPAYPCLRSDEYIASGAIFDVRKSASQMGLLTEFARRHSQARRSLYPTKSVCAIGPLAEELTREHHLSAYGYGTCSPFFKLTQHAGKIIGLGVPTSNLSFVHCVEDVLQGGFPRQVYQPHIFPIRAIDAEGRSHEVPTYSHDSSQMNHNIPRYVAANFPAEVGCDFQFHGMNFFRIQAAPAFEIMKATAARGVTIYGNLAPQSKAA